MKNAAEQTLRRRACLPLLALPLLPLLPACSSSPPLRYHQLALDLPLPAGSAVATRGPVWELVRDLGVPESLQRDSLLLAGDSAGSLQALPNERWAEPLQQALPRLLMHDLQRLRGAERLWWAPAPADVPVDERLRVQLLALDADPARGQLRLQALALWQPARPASASRSRQRRFDLQVPLAGRSASALVAAHREAVLALALALSASVTAA